MAHPTTSHPPADPGAILAPPGEGAQDSLARFWEIDPRERVPILEQAIAQTHAWHYGRNAAYRRAVEARGVGPALAPGDMPRLLRPTAQTFKSYIDLLGTPFPQDQPRAFAAWLADQLSATLPPGRAERLRARYPSLEALLVDIERLYADLGLQISTSSGTSGRSTIMVRDQESIHRTVEAFYLAFQRYMGIRLDHRAIFIMPRRTRIAMARMASFSLECVGWPRERIHFTIPFPAEPDQVRIRAGRTYRSGWRGQLERRLWRPLMNRANDALVMPSAIRRTMALLRQAEAAGDKVMLFGGWIQLHSIALQLLAAGQTLRLAPGSLIGTGGGFKELYPYGQARIRQDLAQAIVDADGQPVLVRDTYGMAEGNWAAMQCARGNYHIPPWIYAVTLDDHDRFQDAPDSVGLLGYYDPFGGGSLFPAFFKTADRVRLVNGPRACDPQLTCPCGEEGAYLAQSSIQRVDLIDEAGCAAQI